MKHQAVWLLSFSDIKNGLLREKKKIFAFGLLLGFVCLVTRLFFPLTYTSEGLFHVVNENPKNVLSKTIQSLGGFDAAASSHDDLNTLLDSPPVLARVVEAHHLQAIIKETLPLWKQIWRNCLLEWAHFKTKKFGSARAPDENLFPSGECGIVCQGIDYHETYYTTFLLTPLEENKFLLTEKKKGIEFEGRFGEQVTFGKIKFTLEQKEKQREPLTLTLISKEMAVKALKDHVRVSADKKKPSLVHFECTHPERELAIKIVDEMMGAYHHFLQEQAMTKAGIQLAWLEKRKQQCHEECEKNLATSLELSNLSMQGRGFFNVENELNHLNEKQRECHALLEEFTREAELLNTSEKASQLTLHLAREMKSEIEKEIEIAEKEKRDLVLAQKLIESPQTHLSAIFSLVKNAHEEKIRTLEYQLLDKKNWSPKEQNFFREELDLEREFLTSHIQKESDHLSTHLSFLNDKLLTIKRELCYLLQREKALIQKNLDALTLRTKHLPQAWIKEQNIKKEIESSQELIKSLSHTIEERNLNAHLNLLQSTPLMKASHPSLPNAPHLFFLFLIGVISGSTLSSLFFVLKTLCEGQGGSQITEEAFLPKKVLSLLGKRA